MCGIAGIYNFDTRNPISSGKLSKMNSSLYHRGPDSEGYFIDGHIGLAHRRLSIIDLKDGHQPMISQNGNIILVFNGEIYNYIELRKELVKEGFHFKTNSDTEVIIAAYEFWGNECYNKFNGMWAIALWDKRINKLILSRDRFGEKPLYYYHNSDFLLFGSEIKAIKQFGIPLEPRLELLEIYLFLTNIPGPDTFYKNTFEVKPGHFMVISSDQITEKKYWDLDLIDEKNKLTNEKFVLEQFEYLLNDSVRIRMRADVEVGAFLSGGLDSSSVVSLMAKNANEQINTFTIGFPNKAFDESELADIIAKQYNTNHHLGTVNPESLNEMIKICNFHFDQPFGDSSAIPTYFVSKFSSQKVKLVLTGDGGDELLSGYNSYLGLKLTQKYNALPFGINKGIPKLINLFLPIFKGKIRYKMNKAYSFTNSASLPFTQRYLHKKPYAPLSKIQELTQPLNCIKIEDFIYDLVNKIPLNDEFYKMMHINYKYDLPNDYLVKVDRMSMSNSLETRTPFLDFRLVELMTLVDKSIKMKGFERKSVLRNTVGKTLPNEILNAPKKGFGVPLREWFKSNENLELAQFEKLTGLLDNNVLNEIIIQNKKGYSDNGNFIWTLIMLESYI
jgi:asparagine synthase (glutamine-hydrolysing)